MITTVPQEQLAALGEPLRADYLAEQAGYTLEIAAGDGEPMAGLLPEGFLEETRKALDALSLARQDKALMADVAQNSTKGQNAAAKAAKLWRRKAVARATRATRFGHTMPPVLLHIGRAQGIPALAGQLDEMTRLFEENIQNMPGKDSPELLREGKDILAVLKSADAAQEAARLKSLPASVRAFYEQKGILYLALKAINDAGHELHAGDSKAASRYDLSILHRRGVKGNGGAPDEASPGA